MPLTMSHDAGPLEPELRDVTLGRLVDAGGGDNTRSGGVDLRIARSDGAPAMDVRRALLATRCAPHTHCCDGSSRASEWPCGRRTSPSGS